MTKQDPPAQPAGRSRVFWPALVTVILVTGYCHWVGWPYVRAAIVRDAAVTTWTRTATAPIAGAIAFEPLDLSEPIGGEGLVAEIRNDRFSREAVDRF